MNLITNNEKLITMVTKNEPKQVATALLESGFNVIEEVCVLKSYINNDDDDTAVDLVFDIHQHEDGSLIEASFYVIQKRDKALTYYFDNYSAANNLFEEEVNILEEIRLENLLNEMITINKIKTKRFIQYFDLGKYGLTEEEYEGETEQTNVVVYLPDYDTTIEVLDGQHVETINGEWITGFAFATQVFNKFREARGDQSEIKQFIEEAFII